jgi:hypothetical protein
MKGGATHRMYITAHLEIINLSFAALVTSSVSAIKF